MSEVLSASLTGDVLVRCPMCAQAEALPREEAARVQALRARLVELRAARSAAEAPALAVAGLTARLRSGQVLGIAGLMLAFWAPQNVAAIGRAIEGARGRPFASVAMAVAPDVASALVVPAVVIGMACGYAWMLVFFRAAVRPTLLARAPRSAGHPARCRGCGGELPASTGASVPCGFCGATNFLGPELAASREALLAAEAAEQRALAQGIAQTIGGQGRASRRFYTGFALGAAGTMAAGVALAIALATSG
jgi:hypothetical protein